MQAVLTYMNGQVRKQTVPDPPPPVVHIQDYDYPFKHLKPEEASKPVAIRFILSTTKNGRAEYFEDGFGDMKDLAFYDPKKGFSENKEKVTQIVDTFGHAYPDFKEHEQAIVKLIGDVPPYSGEEINEYLYRVYQKHQSFMKKKSALEQQEKALKAQQEIEAAKKQAAESMAQLEAIKALQNQNQYKPAWTTQAIPEGIYGYQQWNSLSPVGLAQPQEAAPAPEPEPEKELPHPEAPKGRMIRLKKKG